MRRPQGPGLTAKLVEEMLTRFKSGQKDFLVVVERPSEIKDRMDRVRSTLNNMNLPTIGALSMRSLFGGNEILEMKIYFSSLVDLPRDMQTAREGMAVLPAEVGFSSDELLLIESRRCEVVTL